MDVEALGYRQELKRSHSPFDLMVYGLVFIAPIAPWSSFGFVFNASHGMVPLVYVVGLVAMMFTALSYMTMSAAFPVAGSVYAYAGRGIGESAGFLAGWALLLDYLLLPTLIYVICAVSVHAVAPALPKPLLVVAFLALNTAVNLWGIESTARLSVFMLWLQLGLLALFMIMAVIALVHGVGGAHLSLAPLYDARKVSPALIFRALSLAVLSFLGFDAISTLTEEAKGGARAVGRATMLSLLLAAALFIAQTCLASLFVLNRQVVLGLFLVNQLELLTSMINFGALTGFLAPHLSVVIHFMLRRGSRRWIRHAVVPVIGFAIVAYVLVNAQANAKIAGLTWMAVGLAAVVILKVSGRSAGGLLDEET